MRKLLLLIIILISCSSADKDKSILMQDNDKISLEKLCGNMKIKYGLIAGNIVNGRIEPSINSRAGYKFREGELVFYISKSEKQDTISGDTNYWYNVENQDGDRYWVFGKFIKILDPKVFDYCMHSKIIEKEIDPMRWSKKNPETRIKRNDFYYSIKFENVYFNKKKYYIIRFIIKGTFSGSVMAEGSSSSVFGIYNNEVKYIRGVSNYNLKYYFFDLDNDGYTEFFIQGKPYSLIAISEKEKRNLSPGWGFGGKMPDELLDSYLEVKEIVPGKVCEIIKHNRFDKNQPMRVTKFKWNGQTFVEGPME